MKSYSKLLTRNDKRVDIIQDEVENSLTMIVGVVPITFDLDEVRHKIALPYNIIPPDGGFRKIETFSPEEKKKYRIIAETLAMLDGNAFFGNDWDGNEWYEMYLPAAYQLYMNNGGDTGWAGESSINKPL